jgi:hypothetical protein
LFLSIQSVLERINCYEQTYSSSQCNRYARSRPRSGSVGFVAKSFCRTYRIDIGGGVIDTREGDDTITGTSKGGNARGISNSGGVIAGTGNDTITGTGEGEFVYRVQLPGIGILNSGTIIAGTENDTITGIGKGGGARGISNSGWISGEADNDTIAGIAKGGGAGGEATGISNSGGIGGGTGTDSISGTGTGELNIYGRGGDGTGISNTGRTYATVTKHWRGYAAPYTKELDQTHENIWSFQLLN